MGVNGIYGLSGSGLDIESMVKAGMLTKQNEYDRLYKKEVSNTWEKEAYINIYNDMKTYRYTTLSDYKMQSVMNAMMASSSNEGAVTATANGSAASMAHKVKVNSLATNAYVMTKDTIQRENTTAKDSIYLRDVLFSKMTDNGDGTFDVTAKDASGNDETKNVNASDVAIELKVSDGEGFKLIKYTYADLNNNKSLYDLAADSSNDLNITSQYDSANDSISFYNNDGGAKNQIGFTANTELATKLLNNLHLAATDGETMGDIRTYTTGTENAVSGVNGSITVDGKTYDNLTGNKTTIAGVTYTFNRVSDPGEVTTISVTQNTESIVDKVKQFVEDYNKILDGLNEKYNETKYSDYAPLTKAQEEGMTEKQIEKWNEKAKSGLLNHSSTLRTIISDMRTAIYTPIDGIESGYNSAYMIGISSADNSGHLKLDEDKLRKALSEDPDAAYQVIASYKEDEDGNNVFSETGLAWRLNDVMNKGMKQVQSYAGVDTTTNDDSHLGQLITNLQTKMSSFKTMMQAFEDQLYKKYDALEVAIQRLSVQLGMITGGGQ